MQITVFGISKLMGPLKSEAGDKDRVIFNVIVFATWAWAINLVAIKEEEEAGPLFAQLFILQTF